MRTLVPLQLKIVITRVIQPRYPARRIIRSVTECPEPPRQFRSKYPGPEQPVAMDWPQPFNARKVLLIRTTFQRIVFVVRQGDTAARNDRFGALIKQPLNRLS